MSQVGLSAWVNLSTNKFPLHFANPGHPSRNPGRCEGVKTQLIEIGWFG